MNRFNTRSVGSIYPPPPKNNQTNKQTKKQTNKPTKCVNVKKRNKCSSNKHFTAFLSLKQLT